MKLFIVFKWPSEKSVLMNALILVTETKARHFKDFRNALMLPVCHVASFSETILIFQSVLMALEMEFIYNGKALLLISPLAKDLVSSISLNK